MVNSQTDQIVFAMSTMSPVPLALDIQFAEVVIDLTVYRPLDL
jgi:hypothetical protein